MQVMPKCSICDGKQFTTIDSTKYVRGAAVSEYVQARFDVLFHIWVPGASFVNIKTCFCQQCGFVTNIPRPDEQDVDRKYKYLSTIVPSANPEGNSVGDYERRRGKILYRYLKKYLPSERPGQVLDYGGGTGSLLRKFVEQGCQCDLVDYQNDVIPGVRKIASTLEQINNGAKYDVVICSHVVEHLADPKTILNRLREYVSKTGILYVEVPMEIWGTVPQAEPVTHVNFFTVRSLKALLEAAGFGIESCKLKGSKISTSTSQLVIKLVAFPDSAGGCQKTLNAEETKRFLEPGLDLKFKRRLLMPWTIFPAIKYRLLTMFRN